MGTSILRRLFRRRSWAALVLLVWAAGCEPTGPDDSHLGHLRIWPDFESAVDPDHLDLDDISVVITRVVDGVVLVDTAVAYDYSADDTLGWVLDLDAPPEELEIQTNIRSNAKEMFAADSTIVVDDGPIGTSEVQIVHLDYVGPGWNIASIDIAPSDSLLTHGDTLRYSATAVDADGQPVTDFIVVWETSDPTIASIDSDALLQAPASGRNRMFVVVQTPTGVTDTASVRFLPAPQDVLPVTGDGDTVEVAADVELAVRVVGADGLGLEQVEVHFSAPPGAAVADALVLTDADGVARTTGTVGTQTGEYGFGASVSGVSDTTLRTIAVAGPAAAITFTGQPTETEAAAAITPPVELTVLDAYGNTAATAALSIAIALGDNSGSAALNGTTTVTATDGTALFSDLSLDAPGAGYTLVAEASGLPAVTSEPFDVIQTAASVVVDPTSANLDAFGATELLTATAFDGAQNPIPGAEFVWTSSDELVATIDGTGLVTAVGNGSVLVVVQTGSVSDTATIAVSQVVQRVTVSPAIVEFLALTATQGLTATAWDANDYRVASASATWSSSDDTIATVDSDGLVTAIAVGDATITATVGQVSGAALVSITQEATTVQVTPESVTLNALAESVTLVATAFDAAQQELTDPNVLWMSTDPTVMTIGATGVATSVSSGTALAIAQVGEVSDTATITVNQAVAAVIVTPGTVEFSALTDTTRLSAEVLDPNGNEISGASLTWSSSDEDIATVDPNGLVTAVGNGSAVISATSDTVSGQSQATVDQVVQSVAVTPTSAGISALQDTVWLVASVQDAKDQEVLDATVTWSSSDQDVAIVDDAGLVTAVANGDVTITAASGNVTGTADVSVEQEAAQVEVTPDVESLDALADTARFAVSAWDANGYTMSPMTVWSTSDETVGTVDADGLVTAAGNGSTLVVALVDEVADTASLAVSQVVTSVTVSPETARITALTDTARMTAVARDANGYPVVGATMAWSSSNEGVAVMDDEGLVTAVDNGNATITAMSEEIEGTAAVTVEQEAAVVEVTPGASTLTAFDDTLQLVAVVSDSKGFEIRNANVTWSVPGDAPVAVSQEGVVTALDNGSVNVTASSDEASGIASVLVEQRAAALELAPGTVSFTAFAQTAPLTATVTDANGYEIANATLNWLSSDEAIASVDADGIATSVGNGSTTISVTSDTVGATAAVSVDQVVAAIDIVPPDTTLTAIGATVQLGAIILDVNGYEIAGESVTWAACPIPEGAPPLSGGPPCPVEIDQNGLVTAVDIGVAPVTATNGAVVGTAEVTVTQ